MSSPPDSIGVGSEGYALPTMDVMTGRGFITGKSGSGKSNTASVVAEQLLEAGLTIVIIDTDGEYFGLKQSYELLHVGGDETCDLEVTVEHAEKMAQLAVEENVPIILDVSAYLDPAEAETLIETFLRHLFVKEKTAKKPLLVFVEEVHEYIPEQGGSGEVGDTLVQIAKRGRKRGLGVCGISQRPAAVDKDFITQCNWIVWHRLTWETDTQVVGRIMESSYADSVTDLEDGEAYVLTDWDEQVRRIKFKRKETFDAGATPDLADYEPPDVRSIDRQFIDELQGVGPHETETNQDEDAGTKEESADEDAASDDPDTEVTTSEEETVPTPAAQPAGDAGSTRPDNATSGGPGGNATNSLALEFVYLVAHGFDVFVRAVLELRRTIRGRLRSRPVVLRDSGGADPPTLQAALGIVVLILTLLLVGVLFLF